jgi:hypothetical protein
MKLQLCSLFLSIISLALCSDTSNTECTTSKALIKEYERRQNGTGPNSPPKPFEIICSTSPFWAKVMEQSMSHFLFHDRRDVLTSLICSIELEDINDVIMVYEECRKEALPI